MADEKRHGYWAWTKPYREVLGGIGVFIQTVVPKILRNPKVLQKLGGPYVSLGICIASVIGASTGLLAADSLKQLLGAIAGPLVATVIGLVTGGVTLPLILDGISWGVRLIKYVKQYEAVRIIMNDIQKGIKHTKNFVGKVWQKTSNFFKKVFFPSRFKNNGNDNSGDPPPPPAAGSIEFEPVVQKRSLCDKIKLNQESNKNTLNVTRSATLKGSENKESSSKQKTRGLKSLQELRKRSTSMIKTTRPRV